VNFDTDYEPEHFEQVDHPVEHAPRDFRIVGSAVAWLVLVGVAIGAGYAVDRFAVHLAMNPTIMLVSVVGTSGATLLCGILFVALTKGGR
jgi:hypothetical protein